MRERLRLRREKKQSNNNCSKNEKSEGVCVRDKVCERERRRGRERDKLKNW